MREVEVKYRVGDLEAVLLALEEAGVELGEPVYQDDQAYAPDGWEFGDSRLGVSFPRLRTPGEAMHQAIVLMGFHPTVRVVKTRRTAVLDGISLCVDDVAGLGAYLELDRVIDGDLPAEEIQAGLAAVVTGPGITARRTSDTLIRAAQCSPG